MPKTKEFVSSDSEASDASSEPKQKKAKKAAAEKKPAAKSKGASKNDEEQRYELGKSRFVSVSEFKGRKMISIREYYTADDGDLRPGKKGISLSPEQWEKLKEHMDKVDADLENL